MSSKVELKIKYVKLCQSGKHDEASKVLKQVQNFNKSITKKDSKVIPKSDDKEVEKVKDIKVETSVIKKKSVKKKTSKKERFESIDDLSDIKGIGKETVNDLILIYKDLNSLKEALYEDKVLPIRNDLANKLRSNLI